MIIARQITGWSIRAPDRRRPCLSSICDCSSSRIWRRSSLINCPYTSLIRSTFRAGLLPTRRNNRITVVRTTSSRNLNPICFSWTAIARPVDRVTRRHSRYTGRRRRRCSETEAMGDNANKDCFVSFPGASVSEVVAGACRPAQQL